MLRTALPILAQDTADVWLGPWHAIVQHLELTLHKLIVAAPNLVAALLVFVLCHFAGRTFRSLVMRWINERHQHHNIARVLGRLAQGATFILGLLLAAVIVLPNFTPASLIQFLGIGSVAIGFAFRDILQNYLAGILLLLTEPFRIGDQIVFGSYEGTVEDIQTRATLLRTIDGRRVVVPNGDLFTQSVTVNTAFGQRRLEFDVVVLASSDIPDLKHRILQSLAGVNSVMKEPAADVLVNDLPTAQPPVAPSTVVSLRVRWWINPRTVFAQVSRDQVITAIRNALPPATSPTPAQPAQSNPANPPRGS